MLAVTVGATITAMVLSGCGGATGNEPASSGSAEGTGGSAVPFVFGAFATPLEEPWDGAIHAALTSAAADGTITYQHVDNLSTA
ncbi:MAG: hypothetical protein ABIO33_05720, partial [Leifsonia sp.]